MTSLSDGSDIPSCDVGDLRNVVRDEGVLVEVVASSSLTSVLAFLLCLFSFGISSALSGGRAAPLKRTWVISAGGGDLVLGTSLKPHLCSLRAYGRRYMAVAFVNLGQKMMYQQLLPYKRTCGAVYCRLLPPRAFTFASSSPISYQSPSSPFFKNLPPDSFTLLTSSCVHEGEGRKNVSHYNLRGQCRSLVPLTRVMDCFSLKVVLSFL